MLQFHKTLHTHKVVVHPRHLPLLRLPGGTCRERERGGRGGGGERRERSSEPNRALEKKRQEGRERAQKRGWTEKDDRFEATKCIRGSGRGKEMEQKRLSEESSLVIAKSIHTIVCE